jgi:transposase
VWHILEGRFHQILANAAHIKAVPGRKSDTNDATWISDLLAHGLIRASFVPPQPIQEVRDLTRTRKQLTREIVQHTQRRPTARGNEIGACRCAARSCAPASSVPHRPAFEDH